MRVCLDNGRAVCKSAVQGVHETAVIGQRILVHTIFDI